ncbi:MAG: DUF4105 domain-containing protein [Ectothiorhodospiraceae bacterium]|nr:DUF4105 domain-containing protein [Ectothiorhodospiraceae bacterium]
MRLRYFLPACCLLAWTPLHAGDDPYLQQLLNQARTESVADERAWQNLLHYTDHRWLPRRQSNTRDPRFFLHEDGWRHPELELRATLTAFFQPEDDVADDPDAQHPQCAFPARFHWLKQRLDIDHGRLPAPPCERYQEWYQAIDPGVITLIFADSHMNNPASMFGHTLLRVDPETQREGSRLLSYVINHAAATTETSGMVFAVRGLTGGYPGMFSIMPYYEKVNEYSHLENRDLWEYELGLDQQEVDQMMRHIWELRGVAFPYYFLYQNCSFRLLHLLEVARPSLALTDRFSWWATPTDTMRVALEPDAMLSDIVYRPASRTLLEHRLLLLTEEERAEVLRLAQGGDLDTGPDLQPERLRLVLESAHDLQHYRLEAGDSDQRERLRELLIARSRLGPSEEREPPAMPETRPDQGHGTHRAGIGGSRRGDTNGLALHWRPAYHDLLDPPAGYREWAHISFLDTRLRYDLEKDRLELERLRLVDIESMAPRNAFFRSWSWHIGTGLEQRLRPQEGYALMAGVDGGGGGSWTLDREDRWLAYAGLQAGAWYSARLRDNVRAGAGPRLELLRTGERWRARARAEALAYTDHDPAWRLTLEQDVSLGRHLGLRLGAAREADFDQHFNRVDLTLHWYMNP